MSWAIAATPLMTCFVTAACSRVPVVCESVTHAGEHRRPLPDPPPHRRTQLPPVEPGGDQLQLDRGGAGTPLSWLPVATGDPPHGRSPHAPALLRLARRSLQLRRQVIDGVTGRQQGLHPLAAIALSADVVVGQHLQADDPPTVVERHPGTQVVEGADEGFELERSHRRTQGDVDREQRGHASPLGVRRYQGRRLTFMLVPRPGPPLG